jgi:Domain of unknown function (DUF5753)
MPAHQVGQPAHRSHPRPAPDAAYADAVLRLEPCTLPQATTARIAGLRMRRQHILDQPDRGNYGPLSMKARPSPAWHSRCHAASSGISIDTTARPNATIQVIPSAIVSRTTLGYPITLLRFRVHEVPGVAYIEQLTSALYVREHQRVSGYGQVPGGLALEALQRAESAGYLSRRLCDS